MKNQPIFWLLFHKKNIKKTLKIMIKIDYQFLIKKTDFGPIWGPFWEPLGTILGAFCLQKRRHSLTKRYLGASWGHF